MTRLLKKAMSEVPGQIGQARREGAGGLTGAKLHAIPHLTGWDGFQNPVSCGYTLPSAVLQPDTRFRVRSRLKAEER